MTDDLITDLISAFIAARADGDGVLTIAAVRQRLEAAKLCVTRRENCVEQENPSVRPEDRVRDMLQETSVAK